MPETRKRNLLSLGEFVDKFTVVGQGDIRSDCMVLRGSATASACWGHGEGWWKDYLPLGFTERDEWADGGYRQVYVSPEQRAIITYVEGDIHVVWCETDKAYQRELAAAAEFYKTH